MENGEKTEQEPKDELAELRRQIEELEAREAEHKRVEAQLRSSEESLKILFEDAPDACYLNDLRGTFVDGNRAAEEVTGYRREELIGKNFLKPRLLPWE